MTASDTTALPVAVASLSKHFGAVRAVDDVSFDVGAGEFVTLLGPSGSGKTTLLMMVAGFARPTGGSILLGGQEIIHLPPHRRNIGMVFQNYALFPHMSVAENIAYPLRLRGIGRADCERRVRHVLDLVQLPGYQDRRISQLSGGQRQRIALARAIVFEPRVLLMDEPLSALDKQLRETMQIEIRRLHDRLGMTTISVTHDQREALTMSDRIAVFSSGRLAQIATPSDLYERPQSRFVAEFIGESSFLRLDHGPRGPSYGGRALQLADTAAAAVRAPLLMLRPERLILAAPGDDGAQAARAGCNVFDAVVTDVVYQGDSLLVDLRMAQGERVQARLPNRSAGGIDRPARGAAVEVLLHRDDTRVVTGEDAP
jgi:putative spermidine/putrescine transport system ATP-binding protein